MSSPAQKPRPAPCSTTARKAGARRSRSPASMRASNIAGSSALSLSGRSSRTSATRSAISMLTRAAIVSVSPMPLASRARARRAEQPLIALSVARVPFSRSGEGTGMRVWAGQFLAESLFRLVRTNPANPDCPRGPHPRPFSRREKGPRAASARAAIYPSRRDFAVRSPARQT